MNPFTSLTDFQITYASVLPSARKFDWRLVPLAPCGEIDGIPSIRGQAVATNGILVIVYSSQGKFATGHYQHFVVDEADADGDGERNLKEIEEKGLRMRKQVDLSGLEEFFT